MARWQRGEAEVEKLIRSRELEHVTGLAADGAPLLAQAQKTAATAAGLVQADAHSAYVLAYDAARFACIALLAQQGMRATTEGGSLRGGTRGEGTVWRRFPVVRGPAASAKRAGISPPARRHSHSRRSPAGC